MFRYDLLSQALGANIVLICGEFEPNGAGAVNNLLNVSGRGIGAVCGFTVARISAGLFEITMAEGLAALIAGDYTLVNCGNQALGGLESATVAGPFGTAGGLGNSGRSFRVRARDAAGAAVDITQAAQRKIQFTVYAKTKTF